jgi:hypothetical protein
VLEKDGKDQLALSCGKRRSIIKPQGGKEYHTNNKTKEG